MEPMLLIALEGVLVGLALAVAAWSWPRFRLWQVFALVAIVASFLAVGRVIINTAYYAAAQSAYGGQRMTREEAEAIRGGNLDFLPDSEFREPSHTNPTRKRGPR